MSMKLCVCVDQFRWKVQILLHLPSSSFLLPQSSFFTQTLLSIHKPICSMTRTNQQHKLHNTRQVQTERERESY